MGLGCGATMMKYILFLFNFIFFLCGAVILGTAIWIQVDDDAKTYLKIVDYPDNESNLLKGALILLCVVGAVIFLCGFLGCCGACKESSCMLFTYAFFLIAILIFQFVGAILIVIFRNKFDDELEESMIKIVQKEVTLNNEDSLTLAYQSLQNSLKCCGAENFLDYQNSESGYGENNTAMPVPPTCCKMEKYDKKNPTPDNANACYAEANTWTVATTAEQQLYRTGCYTEFKQWIKDRITIVIGVAFGLVAFEILCIIFACCVRSSINEKY